MNKRVKFITAFLLLVTMTVSGSYVFAGTEEQPSDDAEQAVIEVTEETPVDDEAVDETLPEETPVDGEAVMEEAPQDMVLMNEQNASLEFEGEEAEDGMLHALSVNDDSVTATTLTYKPISLPDPVMYRYPSTSNGQCCSIKVNVKTSGKLWLYAQRVDGVSKPAKVFVGKYDPNTGYIDYSYTTYVSLEPGGWSMGIGGLDVVAGGSYCIGIQCEESGYMNVIPYIYSYATRTLPVNKIMLTEGYKTSANGSLKDSNALFLIKPAKTGFITVSAAEYGCSSSAGYVTLLNSGKRAISDRLLYYSKSRTGYVTFGVQRGVTYYLKVSGFQGSYNEDYCYGIQYKNYAAALRANTSKKKATNLKRKASYITAAMPATGKAGTQWYKFKVKKKRTTKIAIDATYLKSGNTTVTVYCGKKKIGKTTVTKGQINTLTVTNSNKRGKAKKGTYYVKVSKSGYANGQYRIRYLK